MKCDHGYHCTVCGTQVETLEDSWLYLEFVLGRVEVTRLGNTPDHHLRCDPALAQYVVDPEFAPPVVDDHPATDKRRREAAEVAEQERLVTRAWRRLQEVQGKGMAIEEYVLPEIRMAKLLGED
ncbi:MAG: hypothetical protein HZA54_11445 [Planctomycetes bacterium]|nr:hypothetical protein [Planctomycetota bacterium]